MPVLPSSPKIKLQTTVHLAGKLNGLGQLVLPGSRRQSRQSQLGGGVADRKAELGFAEGEEAPRGASSPRQDPGPEQGDRAEHGAGGGLVPNMHPAGMVGLPSAEVLDPMSLSFLICQMGRRMVPTSQIM